MILEMDKDLDAILNATSANPVKQAVIDITKKTRKPRAKKKVEESPKVEIKKCERTNVDSTVPQLNTNISKWKPSSFLIYVREQFSRRFDIPILLKRGQFWTALNTTEVMIMRHLKLDKCDPVLLKTYIDFYFDRIAPDTLLRTKGRWQPKYLHDQEPLIEFTNAFPSLMAVPTHKPMAVIEMPEAPVIPESLSIEIGEVKAAAKLGAEAMIMRFGLIITVNYALRQSFKSGRDKTDILSIVGIAARDAVSRNKKFWTNIKAATEKFSPYPTWLWTDVSELVSLIEGSVGNKLKPIVVNVCDVNPTFEFLR